VKRFSLIVNQFATYIGSIALGLLMFLTVADVLGRYLFNRPVSGTFELTEMLMVPIVFLALGLAQHHNEHIALDLAYTYFPRPVKRGSDVVVDVVNLVVVAAIVWQLYAYSVRMLDGTYTTAVLQLPIHPFVIIAVAGSAAYVLSIICDFGKASRNGKP
jgi:TRAP-type C4-dicarboxylate transport system permease small subunit